MGNREVRLDQPSLVIQPPLAWSLVTPDCGPAPAGSGEVDASGFYRDPAEWVRPRLLRGQCHI